VESLLAISMGMGPNDNSLMGLPPIKNNNSGLLKGLLFPILKIGIIQGGVMIAAFYVGMIVTPSDLYTNLPADAFKDGMSHSFDN